MKKALVISTRFPWPLFHGTSIRTFQMIEHLSNFYHITLLYMTDSTIAKEVEDCMHKYCEKLVGFKTSKLCACINVIKGLFLNKKPLQVNYFYFRKIQKVD